MGGGGSKPAPQPPPFQWFVPQLPPPYVPPPPTKFKRGSPPADMSLKISKSADCSGCVFGIDVGVSSSLVTLSRDVLGKIAVPATSVSDKWVWDDRVGFEDDGTPKLLQSSSEIGRDCDGIGCRYLRANPTTWDKKWNENKITPDGYVYELNQHDLQMLFNMDLAAWKADHQIAKLKKTSGKKVRMWNPSDDPDDLGGSQAINNQNYGALTKLFLKPTLPFNVTFAPASASISLMSVYQPFPLRVDSFAEQGKQYDACFQIGEFHSDNITGTTIVILVPLKVSPNPGVGGSFVNAFASKIPSILGQQPDPLLGYPDVPAQTGANWDVSKVVDTTRPYYTWKTSDGTRVIVMAEPILIAEGDMGNIQRLPVTPPEDVIHELPSFIQYKPAPPLDVNGNPVPCPSEVAAAATAAVVQPPVVANKPAVDTNLWLQVILGMIGTIAIIIGVWFGIKLASGPVGEMLKKLGDSLGSSLAGGYGAMKRARSGIGQNRPLPPPRTAEQIAAAPPPANTPAAISDLPTPDPTGFQVANPGYTSLNDFADRHRTRKNKVTLKTPTQLANISPVNLPEPSGDFAMYNPLDKSRADFVARQRTMRNRPRTRVTPAPRVDAAEQNRLAQPAGTGLFDLGMPTTPAAVVNATEPFPDAAETNRLAQPAGTGLFDLGMPTTPAAPTVQRRRRNVAVEPEETPEERMERRAEETALPRRTGMPTGPRTTGADTGIFGSPAMRSATGVRERGNRGPYDMNTTRFGGKRKRRHRLKTGRRV